MSPSCQWFRENEEITLHYVHIGSRNTVVDLVLGRGSTVSPELFVAHQNKLLDAEGRRDGCTHLSHLPCGGANSAEASAG